MPYPRKPAALKRAAGNPGKRPLPGEPEPERLTALPRCPSWIKGDGRRAWATVGGDMLALGILSRLDLPVLAGLCVQWGRWVAAEKVVADEGALIRLANGTPVRNPAVGVANQAFDRLLAVLREVAGTPASRSKVQLTKDAGAPSLAQIMFGEIERAKAGGADPREVLRGDVLPAPRAGGVGDDDALK
jgi:P27 family predicted phage terminase small subunit